MRKPPFPKLKMKIMIETLTLIRGDKFCENPEDFKIQSSKEPQIVSLLRAESVQVLDRGNSKITVTFKIAHQHTCETEAINYIMKHTADIRSIHGNATFELEDTNNTTFRLTNANVRQVTSFFVGSTSFHSYELIGSTIESSNKLPS